MRLLLQPASPANVIDIHHSTEETDMRNRKDLFPMLASICALTLSTTGIAAGLDTKPLKHVGGRGFFMVGANTMDIDKLNARLKNNGYQTFSKTGIAFGGGGFGILNRLIIGGEGFGVSLGSKSGTVGADTYKTSLNGGYGLFKIGYVVYKRGGFIFYPATEHQSLHRQLPH
jgi:hypothetical protein